ncbi:unnamed protein product [Rhizophagus irregularis]|uniref:Uncharacterized protein n=3 Tax=Rhizophagus irregularis TaxID=588596 RepID=A0A916DYY3_9GLOM|nr:unnamed protein product [Rhizophagus irregularis]CAB5298665.1 unnamed protein product [Rhizophagus irregularis]
MMGKLSGSKRPYNSQIEVINIRKDKRNSMTEENKNSLKTICNGLCENPFLFNQLDEEIKEKLSQNARRLVEYVEFKQNNGGVKRPYSECVKNYEEKQKRQKLRRSMTIKTKSDFGVLLNHTGNNIIENNPFSRVFSKLIADIPSRTVSDIMNYTKMKTLPKRASHRILPRISLSSIQQMASPIIQEPNWIDFIEKSTLPKATLLPLKSTHINGDLNKTKVSCVIHNYSERTVIAAEGMLMLSTLK